MVLSAEDKQAIVAHLDTLLPGQHAGRAGQDPDAGAARARGVHGTR